MHPRGETREPSKPPTSKGDPPGSEDAQILRSARVLVRSFVAAKASDATRRELIRSTLPVPRHSAAIFDGIPSVKCYLARQPAYCQVFRVDLRDAIRIWTGVDDGAGAVPTRP